MSEEDIYILPSFISQAAGGGGGGPGGLNIGSCPKWEVIFFFGESFRSLGYAKLFSIIASENV